MGAIIYINGEFDVKGLTENTADKVRKIQNGWGYESFDVSKDLNLITFKCDSHEGCTPLDDGVESPLEALLKLAKEEKFDVSGSISIFSDYSDYSNITITVENGEIRHENTEIVNATTEELIAELKKRHSLADSLTVDANPIVLAAKERLFYLSTVELYHIYEQKTNLTYVKRREEFINDMSAETVWGIIESRIKNRETAIVVCRENETDKSYALVSDIEEAFEAKKYQEDFGYKVRYTFMDYHNFMPM